MKEDAFRSPIYSRKFDCACLPYTEILRNVYQAIFHIDCGPVFRSVVLRSPPDTPVKMVPGPAAVCAVPSITRELAHPIAALALMRR
jgi:hypothetical protein